MFQRFRNSIARFMMGRYGNDQLNRALFWAYFVLWLASMLFGGWTGFVLSTLTTVAAVVLIWRMLSRDIPRRQAENRWFLDWWSPIKQWFTHQWIRLRDIRRFRYRRCPACRSRLRLPIKRGRRTVTCPRCAHRFKAFFL